MKKEMDTNFARAILILAGALIIFSFWFLANGMQDDYTKTPVVPNTLNPQAGESDEKNDPVLKDVDIDDIIIETTDEIEGIDDLSEIEDIDLTDINF